MKVPPKRKGNVHVHLAGFGVDDPSMKVPPKRKGNVRIKDTYTRFWSTLNESPSEKEGKLRSAHHRLTAILLPQ